MMTQVWLRARPLSGPGVLTRRTRISGMTKERGDCDEAFPSGRDQSIIHSPHIKHLSVSDEVREKGGGHRTKRSGDGRFLHDNRSVQACGVGDTSVIRFCRKLGYTGYQEFKLSLAQNLGTVEERISGNLEPGDDLEKILKR